MHKKKSKRGCPLLRKVFYKSMSAKMTLKDQIVMVNMLVQRYALLFIDYDQQAMANLVVLLREIHGSEFPDMELSGSDLSYVRRMLLSYMPDLIASIEKEFPFYAEKLKAIDWRTLFAIVEAPVEVTVTPPSPPSPPDAPSDDSTESTDSAIKSMDSAKAALSDID